MPTRSVDRLALVVATSDDLPLGSTRASFQPVCGRPAICFVVGAALRARADEVLVVSDKGSEDVSKILPAIFGEQVLTLTQAEPLTAFWRHADRGHDPVCFVLQRDLLLIEPEDLNPLAEAVRSATALAVLTAPPRESGVLDRKPAQNGRAQPLDEQGGASACRLSFLRAIWTSSESNSGSTGLNFRELCAAAARLGTVVRVPATRPEVLRAIEDRVQFAAAEDRLYARIADELRRAGVWIRGHPRIDASVVVEAEAIIEDRVVLRGATRIASGARIEVGSVLTDTAIGARAIVRPYSVCSQAAIGEMAEVGPFCHIRPDSEIQANARIGNFVETKRVTVRRGAMANHLAYLGDGEVGEEANIGAGTIFCNSDGINKHWTHVGDRAFVGSACQLVAPVRVGGGAFVATGTTVTRDVPDDALAIARVPQVNKEHYATRLRERFAALAGKLMAPRR